MNNWKKYKLAEIAEIVGGGTPSTEIDDYWNGDISWITPKDLSNFNFRYISRGERNITEKGQKNSNATFVLKNTVLLSSRAPVGYLAIANNNLTTNQGFKSLIVNNEKANFMFVYYLLLKNVEVLKANSSGTTFGELSSRVLKNLEFDFPNLEIQTRIANFLSQLDDRIELNRQINNNLEELADTYFKRHFFVNKENSGGLGELITEKTESVKNENLEQVQILSAVKTGDLINSEEYFTKQVFSQNISKYKKVTLWDFAYNPARINIGSIGMLNRDILGGVSPVYTVFRAKKGYEHFINLLIKQNFTKKQIENLCFGGVRQVLRFSDLASIQIPIPTETEIKEFNTFYLPLLAKIESNKKQNETLANYRDSILPKLMSGAIEI